MYAKTIEIRDAATFIPAMAVRLDPYHERDRYLLARAGFGVSMLDQEKYIILIHLTSMRCEYDPMKWGNRTMENAHRHIIEMGLDNFLHGEVVDVQYILGETDGPKVSEQEKCPL